MRLSDRGAAVAVAAGGNVAQVHHFDSAERKFVFEDVQDVAPILEHNKQLRGERQTLEWGRHTATIPNIILTRWFHEELDRGNVHLKMYGKEFDELIMKKLNDPDWKWLRTDI